MHAKVEMLRAKLLAEALKAYWSASTPGEERAAYYEILLFGGIDGYRNGWRSTVARWLRRAALLVER